MPNQYAGVCYRCGKIVPAGEGVFEKVSTAHRKKWPGKCLPKWHTQHHDCAKEFMGTKAHHEYAPAANRLEAVAKYHQ